MFSSSDAFVQFILLSLLMRLCVILNVLLIGLIYKVRITKRKMNGKTVINISGKFSRYILRYSSRWWKHW